MKIWLISFQTTIICDAGYNDLFSYFLQLKFDELFARDNEMFMDRIYELHLRFTGGDNLSMCYVSRGISCSCCISISRRFEKD